MSEQPENSEAIETARGLGGDVRGLAAEVRALRSSGRRNWRLTLFDIVLTIALAAFGYLSVQQHSALVAACQAGNQTRAQERALWAHLASLSKPPAADTPAEAAAQRASVADLLAYVDSTFAPKNCQQVYRLP